MIAQLNTPQAGVLIIMALAFILLITERVGNDVVGVLIILALYALGLLKADDALSGFASEPAIVVASIFVMSGAIYHTGLSEMIGALIGRLAGHGYRRMLAVIMPAVALLSAFTHHVTTTALMLPVMLSLARTRNISPSRLLMPLSFAASLGTTITIIGAPAFLLASGVLRQAGRPGLSVFSIAPLGLSLTLVGTLYMLAFGQYLLPDRAGGDEGGVPAHLAEYFTKLTILPGSPLQQRTVGEVQALSRQRLQVVGWIRNRLRLRGPFRDRQLQPGDVLLVQTTPDEMEHLPGEMGVDLTRVSEYGSPDHQPVAGEGAGQMLIQVLMAPQSDLIGRRVVQVNFPQRYDASVVGLWRGEGWLHEELEHTRLAAGDVLVLQGDLEALERIARDPAFMITGPARRGPARHGRAALAGAIMLVTILAATLTQIPLSILTLAGAAAMVLSGCLTRRQALRAIDPSIYIFIAGAIPLSLAMQQNGVTAMLASWLQTTVGAWAPTLVLFLFFAASAGLTQFLSDSATTAILAPVAAGLAQALGRAPEPYVVTVAMASVAAFITPIGHHGSLLVYGPGRYRFADFVKTGVPLTVLIAIVIVFLTPVLWPR